MAWVTIPTVSIVSFVDMDYWRIFWTNLLHLKDKFWEVVAGSATNTTVTVTSATFANIGTTYSMEFDTKGDRPVMLGCSVRWTDTVGDNANLGAIRFLVDGVSVNTATEGAAALYTTVGDSFGEMRVFNKILTLTAGHHTFRVQAKQNTGSTGNLQILFNNANPQLWAIEL